MRMNKSRGNCLRMPGRYRLDSRVRRLLTAALAAGGALVGPDLLRIPR